MVIDIQFQEAARLYWEMLKEIPENRRAYFGEKINNVVFFLDHPTTQDGNVFVTLRTPDVKAEHNPGRIHNIPVADAKPVG